MLPESDLLVLLGMFVESLRDVDVDVDSFSLVVCLVYADVFCELDSLVLLLVEFEAL